MSLLLNLIRYSSPQSKLKRLRELEAVGHAWAKQYKFQIENVHGANDQASMILGGMTKLHTTCASSLCCASAQLWR